MAPPRSTLLVSVETLESSCDNRDEAGTTWCGAANKFEELQKCCISSKQIDESSEEREKEEDANEELDAVSSREEEDHDDGNPFDSSFINEYWYLMSVSCSAMKSSSFFVCENPFIIASMSMSMSMSMSRTSIDINVSTIVPTPVASFPV